MQWGIEKADVANARIYVEATPVGRLLYAKHGFQPIEQFTIDFAPVGGFGSYPLTVMIRERRDHSRPAVTRS